MTIAIVIDADDEDEAKRKGRNALENYFMGEGGFFDYDRDVTMDGKLLTHPVTLDTPMVDVVLSNMFATQAREFSDSCNKLRTILAEHTNDVLYDEKDNIGSELWYNCHMISSRCGGAFRVYDCDGEPFLYANDVYGFAKVNPTKTYVYLRDVHY